MTTVAVLADPPHPETALSELVAASPLSKTEAAELYTALLRDSVLAVERSGGDLLVNYRPAEALGLEVDSEALLRDAVAEAVDPESIRFEVQVGETFAGRAGNTAAHLLETEGVGSVGITRPETAFLARTDVDEAAMKLRSAPVVLGPSSDGHVGYAAFREPIDFADCYRPPAIETLTDRAIDADLDVAFLERKPFLADTAALARSLVDVRTRRKAGALVPPHLGEWVSETELTVSVDDGVSLER
jgi:hypothetical protein